MHNPKDSMVPAHLFSPDILLATPVQLQTTNQLVLWQQFNAFMHADVVKVTSNQASRMNGVSIRVWVRKAGISKTDDLLGFVCAKSLGLTENSLKERKYQVVWPRMPCLCQKCMKNHQNTTFECTTS